MKISTGGGGLATLGLIGAAIGVGISSGGALIAIPLVFMFILLFVCLFDVFFLVWCLFVCLFIVYLFVCLMFICLFVCFMLIGCLLFAQYLTISRCY